MDVEGGGDIYLAGQVGDVLVWIEFVAREYRDHCDVEGWI